MYSDKNIIDPEHNSDREFIDEIFKDIPQNPEDYRMKKHGIKQPNSHKPKKSVNSALRTPRKQWSSHCRYIFCLLAISFNFENSYIFPFQLLENGGVIFLFCVIMLVFLYGAPLIFLEISLGQFPGYGVLECWNFAPLFKGIGISMMIFNAIYLINQNFVAGLFLFHMPNSLHNHMPWYYCMNKFNDIMCQDAFSYNKKDRNVQSSLDQFWYIHINSMELKNSSLISIISFDENLKIVSYTVCIVILLILTFFNWHIINYLVYPLTIYPIICYLILIGIGFSLTGNIVNLFPFLYPDPWKLLSPATWLAAMEFVIYSFGLGYGMLLTISSYSNIKNDIISSVITIISADIIYFCFQSVLSLQTFRYIMHKHVLTFEDMRCYKGLNLLFVGIPEMLGHFDWSNLWTFVYFSALFILSLGRTFATMEVLLCGIFDKYPKILQNEFLKFLAFFLFFMLEHLIGLLYFSIDGYYFYILITSHLNGFNRFGICLSECVIVFYVYKFENFSLDYKIISGKILNPLWKIMFLLIIPMISIIGIILKLYNSRDASFYYIWTEVKTSHFCNIYGYIGSFIILMPIPIYAVYFLYQSKIIMKSTFKEAFYKAITPKKSWGPSVLDDLYSDPRYPKKVKHPEIHQQNYLEE